MNPLDIDNLLSGVIGAVLGVVGSFGVLWLQRFGERRNARVIFLAEAERLERLLNYLDSPLDVRSVAALERMETIALHRWVELVITKGPELSAQLVSAFLRIETQLDRMSALREEILALQQKREGLQEEQRAILARMDPLKDTQALRLIESRLEQSERSLDVHWRMLDETRRLLRTGLAFIKGLYLAPWWRPLSLKTLVDLERDQLPARSGSLPSRRSS